MTMAAWTDITSTRVDADSPVDEDLVGDLNDNSKSLREQALRCGTNTTGVRLTLARGRFAANITLDGSGNGVDTNTITFSSSATDGDPNFSAAPTCLGLTFEESSVAGDEVGSPSEISLTINESGGVTATAANLVTVIRGGTTGVTINYYIHWAFVGPMTSGE